MNDEMRDNGDVANERRGAAERGYCGKNFGILFLGLKKGQKIGANDQVESQVRDSFPGWLFQYPSPQVT